MNYKIDKVLKVLKDIPQLIYGYPFNSIGYFYDEYIIKRKEERKNYNGNIFIIESPTSTILHMDDEWGHNEPTVRIFDEEFEIAIDARENHFNVYISVNDYTVDLNRIERDRNE